MVFSVAGLCTVFSIAHQQPDLAADRVRGEMAKAVVGQAETIDYVSYNDGLAFDSSLFEPPAGIVVQRSK